MTLVKKQWYALHVLLCSYQEPIHECHIIQFLLANCLFHCDLFLSFLIRHQLGVLVKYIFNINAGFVGIVDIVIQVIHFCLKYTDMME